VNAVQNMSLLAWRTASLCESGACVEVAPMADGVAIRNSTRPTGPVIYYSAAEWRTFLAGVKRDEFDFAFDR